MSEVVSTIIDAAMAVGTAFGGDEQVTPESPMEAYRLDFESADAVSTEPAWTREMRRSALGVFEREGFPTMKDEDWHFTSVGPIAEKIFRRPGNGSAVSSDVVARLSHRQDWHTIVFVNGRIVSGIGAEAPSGVRITSLETDIAQDSEVLKRHLSKLATAESGSFTALNAAMATDGAVVCIDADALVTKPIHLLFIADTAAEAAAVQTRNLVFAERHSEATVIESYASVGGDSYLTNAVTEVFVAEGARLSHYKLQTESINAFHVGTVAVHQARGSRYESFSFATGARLSRTNIYSTLAGDAAEVVMNGLYMVDGAQHVDHQTRIEHVAPNCPSHELYKGILDGRSHGVFNGKVYVHPEAQKTDGKQSNNNLLLSDAARVDTKPQLEIFADDVKCTHGATVGRLDETALFYMRSRGIGPAQSKRLLTYAFAADVLEKIELEPLREALEAQVLDRFTAA
ncbi:MAG TPA: Fe-S cluster assembly protein SufD [Gemmatimonadaceae bacterium]|nr:Fe-S cluster assembly protein SufD [Gemmatimonadaceae bacterium]